MDPREIRQALNEIKQLRSEGQRFVKQLQKLGSAGDDLAKLNGILAKLNEHYATISNRSADPSDVREAIQDFHEARYWDEVNLIRTRLEIPRELKQITASLKRIKRIVKIKGAKDIVNIGRVEQAIAEVEQRLGAVQAAYNSGDLEEAMEEMRSFHEEGGHPGEIEGAFYRLREVKQRLRSVRDANVKAQIEQILQEAVNEFNAGNFREARETIEERKVMDMINRATQGGWFKR